MVILPPWDFASGHPPGAHGGDLNAAHEQRQTEQRQGVFAHPALAQTHNQNLAFVHDPAKVNPPKKG
jgi:hypothetical protein